MAKSSELTITGLGEANIKYGVTRLFYYLLDDIFNIKHALIFLMINGHGQVLCFSCNKTFGTTELSKDCEFHGGWLIADYLCPAQHKLLSRDVAHFMFSRNY